LTEDIVEKLLVGDPDTRSYHVYKKELGKHIEYWTFPYRLFKDFPIEIQKAFNLQTDYMSIKKEDCPCWVLTDNNYVTILFNIYYYRYSRNNAPKFVSPHAFFATGMFKKVRNIYTGKYDPPFLTSYVNINEVDERAFIFDKPIFNYKSDDIMNDPRIYPFVEIFLQTGSGFIAYATAFNNPKLCGVHYIWKKAQKLLHEPKVREYMEKILAEKARDVLEKLDIKSESVESYILEKRIQLVEKAMNDNSIHNSDLAIKGLENFVKLEMESIKESKRKLLLSESGEEVIEVLSEDKSDLLKVKESNNGS